MNNELRKQAVKHLDEYIEWIKSSESRGRETYPRHLGRVLCVRNELDWLRGMISFDEFLDAHIILMNVSHMLGIYYERSQGSKNVTNREDVWETARRVGEWARQLKDMAKKHTS